MESALSVGGKGVSVGFFSRERRRQFSVCTNILKFDMKLLTIKLENDTGMSGVGYNEEESCSKGTSRQAGAILKIEFTLGPHITRWQNPH